MSEIERWQPVSAWTSIAEPGRGGAMRDEPGVRIELEHGAQMLSIVARSGPRAELERIAGEELGVDLPAPGLIAEGSIGDLVWSGPDHWLLLARGALRPEIRHDLGRVASVTDQSSARALLHVSGVDARDALAKGFSIDLHPGVFETGHAAVTRVAHISVQIWQREAGRYTIAVPRSFASSFWSWLVAACAAYGYEVATFPAFSRSREKAAPRSGVG